MKFQQTCVWELKGIHGLCRSYVCPHLLWCLDFSFRTWCYSDFKTLQRRQPPSEESWEKATGFTFVLQALVACSPWCSAQRCGLCCASLAASCCFHSVSAPHLKFTTCERHWGTTASFPQRMVPPWAHLTSASSMLSRVPVPIGLLGFLSFFWSYFENTLKMCWIFLHLGIGREWESRV